MTHLAQAVAAEKDFLDHIIYFIDKGGVFIYFIILCSIAAMTVMLYQSMLLKRKKVIPESLVKSIDVFVSKGDEPSAENLMRIRELNPSVLQKLCDVVLERHDRKDVEIQDAVQVVAREEIHKLQVGIPFLEVIISIAPLLGLLGTATGLFDVFEGVGANGSRNF
jgi:biopolymer transport protein ExbB